MRQIEVEFFLEIWVVSQVCIELFQISQRRHQVSATNFPPNRPKRPLASGTVENNSGVTSLVMTHRRYLPGLLADFSFTHRRLERLLGCLNKGLNLGPIFNTLTALDAAADVDRYWPDLRHSVATLSALNPPAKTIRSRTSGRILLQSNVVPVPPNCPSCALSKSNAEAE